MMKACYGFLLKAYLYLHERLHERILHSLAIRYFDGLHPKNVFHYRSDFFRESVDAESVVVDLACGTGRILASLAPRISRGLGFDLSDQNLAECRKHHSRPNLEFRKGDVLVTDYEALRAQFPYDVAIFSHILEHIDDVPGLLRKVGAARILICVPSQENWHRQTMKHLGLRYTTDPTHFREYTRAMLSEELALAGYRASQMGFNSEGEIICRAERA